MAQGPNYNVILPFSTTNTIVPSTIVVGGLTVNGDINAQRFVALNTGTTSTPAFTFTEVGTSAGMYYDSTIPGLAFSTLGTVAAAFVLKSFAGGPTLPAIQLGQSSPVYITYDPTSTARASIFTSDATTTAEIVGRMFRIIPGSSNNGLMNSTNTHGLVFGIDGSLSIYNAVLPDSYSAVWDVALGSQYFCRPGVLQQQTTTAVPSAVRSSGHVTNLIAGITTVFVTLPTTVPGLQYTISNAHAVANTVVISPVGTADTINVFGLTKAVGASVAASAAFSSITFHCITSTQWLATDIMGTWV